MLSPYFSSHENLFPKSDLEIAEHYHISSRKETIYIERVRKLRQAEH